MSTNNINHGLRNGRTITVRRLKHTALTVAMTAALATAASVPAPSALADAASPATAGQAANAAEEAAVSTKAEDRPEADAVGAKPQSYALTSDLQVEVKSLLNETTCEGTRIAAVVRVKSTGAKVIRIPDYDVRVKTADGFEYTLQASVFNAHAIRPQTTEELSYMVTADRRDPVGLTDLVWYAIDWYSYPKRETVQLSVPVAGTEWTGPLSGFAGDSAAVLNWGRTFSFANSLDSRLEYTPVSISKDNTPQGPITTVKLLVENVSPSKKETVPDFTLDGKAEGAGAADRTVYTGKRAESGPIVLEPKEKRYIHFAIPTDKDTRLTAVNVLTPETFRQLDAKGQPSVTSYSVGRFRLTLPDRGTAAAEFAEAQPYEAGRPFAFDELTDAIDPNLAVSMVELHRHENEGEGYQTVIAKLMFSNKGDLPIPVPALQTKLLTEQGLTYAGSRQNGTIAEIMPLSNYVVSYAFNLPSEVADTQYALKFAEAKAGSPSAAAIGTYKVALQPSEPDLNRMSFYPFHLKLNDWSLTAITNLSSSLQPGPVTYTYKLKLLMDIEREAGVVVDQNFSKLQLELVDPKGKVLSIKNLPFTGVNRLISGTQFIQFDNLRPDEQEYPCIVNIYETIATATGEAKRLVGVLKQ